MTHLAKLVQEDPDHAVRIIDAAIKMVAKLKREKRLKEIAVKYGLENTPADLMHRC